MSPEPRPKRVVSAPILRTSTPVDKSVEPDQVPTGITEPGPPTHADLPAESGEADAPNESPTRTPEDANGPQPTSRVAARGDHRNNLAEVDDPKASQRAAAQALGTQVNFRDRLKIGAEGPEMMVIPSGHFRMGDLSGSGDQSEQPVHAVILESHFAIGRYAVTFEEYDLFCEAMNRSKPSDEGWGRGHKPVINVSWEDANAFCNWLSEQSGFHYRLPSEAEWEYATRAGTESAYWWGEEFNATLAHCDSTRTVPTDESKTNPFGLSQMHGNVWEWVEDVWHEDYREAPEDGSAQSEWPTRIKRHVTYLPSHYVPWSTIMRIGPFISPNPPPGYPPPHSYTHHEDVEDRSAGHVLRGGSWKDQPFWLRSSARQPASKSDPKTTGFRVVREVPSTTKTQADAQSKPEPPASSGNKAHAPGRADVDVTISSVISGDGAANPARTLATADEFRAIAPQAEVSGPSERPTLPLAPDGVLPVIRDASARIERFLSSKRTLFQKLFGTKIDDESLRQFFLALRAVETALYDNTISEDVRRQAIMEARESLPRYAELDPRRDLDFGPLQGCRMRAIANAALAKIYEAWRNQILSDRHRLLAFINEPRVAREKLFPEFYQHALSEKCQAKVDDWYHRALSELNKIDYRTRMPPANAIGIVDRMSYVSQEWKDQEIRRIKNTTPETLKEDDMRRIRDGISDQTDKACIEIARDMLHAV